MPVTNPYVPNNKYIAFGSAANSLTDLSDYCTDCDLVRSVDERSFTTFDDTDYEQIEAGIESWMVNATFVMDYSTGGPYATLNSLVGTTAYFEMRPDGGAASATNNKITGQCFVSSLHYVPSGAKREVGTFTISYRSSGAITVATS